MALHQIYVICYRPVLGMDSSPASPEIEKTYEVIRYNLIGDLALMEIQRKTGDDFIYNSNDDDKLGSRFQGSLYDQKKRRHEFGQRNGVYPTVIVLENPNTGHYRYWPIWSRSDLERFESIVKKLRTATDLWSNMVE